MPVALNTQFAQLYLSADLPEKVSFSTQDENASADVVVYVDHEPVFITTMYSFGHDIALYDLRSIIETAIRERNTCTAECCVGIRDSISDSFSRDFTVVISDFSINNHTAFLNKYFLTTRSSFRIHRQGKQTLSWVAPYTTAIERYIEAVILPNDSDTPIVQRWDEGRQQNYGGTAYATTLYIETIEQHFENTGRLLSFTIHRGARSMTFYVTDEQPDFHLAFLNAFNVQEYAELYATTTLKQKVERSEAHCLNDRIFYDQQEEQTHEVETAVMPYGEAKWLNQLLASRQVTILRNGYYRPILITDSTSEITDSDKDLIRLKFTWKFVKRTQYHYADFPPQIFLDEFNPQYL